MSKAPAQCPDDLPSVADDAFLGAVERGAYRAMCDMMSGRGHRDFQESVRLGVRDALAAWLVDKKIVIARDHM